MTSNYAPALAPSSHPFPPPPPDFPLPSPTPVAISHYEPCDTEVEFDDDFENSIPHNIRAIINRDDPIDHSDTSPVEASADPSEDLDAMDTDEDWEFNSDEVQTNDYGYQFCPAAHRKQLLTIITRHFCRHSFFPTRNGTHKPPPQIRNSGLRKRSKFFKTRGLSKVWAHSGINWFALSFWKSWPRQTIPNSHSPLR